MSPDQPAGAGFLVLMVNIGVAMFALYALVTNTLPAIYEQKNAELQAFALILVQ